MVERFGYKVGIITVANGATTVFGTGSAWGGHDWEGSQIWTQPQADPGGAPVRVGTVAAIVPRGVYLDLQLPLLTAYQGTAITDSAYELIDGAAIANGATQAAIYARYAAHLASNMGLIGNTADDGGYATGVLSPDFAALVPNNSIFLDSVTNTLYQLRGGVLEIVKVIGDQWVPKGAWVTTSSYDKSDLVQNGDSIFVSSVDSNLGNTPDDATPASDAFWTWVPIASVNDVLAALGVNNITISTLAPSGGSDNDLWIRVPV